MPGLGKITHGMKQILRDLRLGLDPRRNDLGGRDESVTRQRMVALQKRGLLDAEGKLTPAGEAQSK